MGEKIGIKVALSFGVLREGDKKTIRFGVADQSDKLFCREVCEAIFLLGKKKKKDDSWIE